MKKLWCIVGGKEDARPFKITISTEKHIYGLRKIISEEIPERLHPFDLVLWKPKETIRLLPVENRTKLVEALQSNFEEFAKKLDVAEHVEKVFQSTDEESLGVIVQLPTSKVAPKPLKHAEGGPPLKMRKMDYDASEYKHLNITPSQFAKPSIFRDLMDEEKRGREIYIHNRPIDCSSVPLTLISPIFGRLSDDVFTTPEGDLRSVDFAPARNLANMLSRLEKEESTRKEAFRQWLLETLQGIEEMNSSDDEHELLDQHTVGLPKLATLITRAKEKSLESDGHVEWRDNVLIITEGRAGSSEPLWQSMAYFRAYYMQERCSYRVGKSCLPAILIAYHGPYIDISGAIVCPDGSVQVQALTSGLRVDCDFYDDRQRNLLAGFVRALRNAFKELQEFYKSPSGPFSGYSSREAVESPDRWFPYRNSYKDGNGVEHSFKYTFRLTESALALVFVAEHTDPDADLPPIAVKFTCTYSEYVHNLLAAEGFAPELFAVEDLAGGWKMVVMEFLLDSDWTTLEMKTYEERLRYKEKLWEALCVIHDKGLVHGDVRDPNIFVSENGDVKLIDFDYCGRHEQGRYPRDWDHRHFREDAMEGDLMRKEHDVFLFNRIFGL